MMTQQSKSPEKFGVYVEVWCGKRFVTKMKPTKWRWQRWPGNIEQR